MSFPTQPDDDGGVVAVSVPDPARPFRYALNYSIVDKRSGPYARSSSVGPGDEDEVRRLAAKHGPLTFVALSAYPDVLRMNLLRSVAYVDPVLPGGHRWAVIDGVTSNITGAAQAYACLHFHPSLVLDWDRDVLVFLHDDVHLLPGFELDTYRQLDRLEEEEGGDWCAIGAAGGTALNDQVVGHAFDLGFEIMPEVPDVAARVARFVPDELMLLLRRSSPARFGGDQAGFHCYGMDLSMSCLAAGSDVHLTDTATTVHKAWFGNGSLMLGFFDEWASKIVWDQLLSTALAISIKWMERVDVKGMVSTVANPSGLDMPSLAGALDTRL